jgi:hypothetical protein
MSSRCAQANWLRALILYTLIKLSSEILGPAFDTSSSPSPTSCAIFRTGLRRISLPQSLPYLQIRAILVDIYLRIRYILTTSIPTVSLSTPPNQAYSRLPGRMVSRSSETCPPVKCLQTRLHTSELRYTLAGHTSAVFSSFRVLSGSNGTFKMT